MRIFSLKVLVSVVWVFVAVFGSSAHTQVDPETQSLLIEKLTQVYLSLPAGDPSRNPIVLRLADLHAERARQASMQELNKGCTVCEAGLADRKKAIRYYEETLPKLSKESQSKVLIQLGHMHEVMGQEPQAITAYQKVIDTAGSPLLTSEAQLSLGEIYFKKGQCAEAKNHYQEVLKLGGSKGLAAYRAAWCEFNLGNVDAGIAGLSFILKNPEYLNRSSSAQTASVDKQFQEEVSRDLATFMAKSNNRSVATLYELSPESTKLDNVFALAVETERLGQGPASIEAWKFLLEKETRADKKLEGRLRLAQIYLDTKSYPQAVQEFDAGLNLWQTIHCEQDKQCAELKIRLRKFVTDYHRLEKKTPSEALHTSYQRYLEVFPNDSDMRLWSGEVAKDLKKYPEAVASFSAAAKLSAEELKTLPSDSKEAKAKVDFNETALLAAVEAAELSQDMALQTAMDDQYLAMSIEKKKAFEIQYQKAHMLYEKNNYQAASVALRELALSSQGSLDIKKKSADLALDSLAILKDDKTIEIWAQDFAKTFPSQKSEFQSLARKSVLKQSAESADNEAAWAALSKYNLNGATDEERISYYKNKLILAEKRQDFANARTAADELLKLPVNADDKQFALSRKAYFSEMALDFSSALQAMTDMKTQKNDKNLLKLGMYASLAKKDPKPFYREYLAQGNKSDESVIVASLLVRESADPAVEMNKQKALLAKNPDLQAELYLEIYAKNRKPAIAKLVLNDPKLQNTSAGKVIRRSELLAEYDQLKAKLAAAKMDGSNQKKMSASLKVRTQLLEQSEKLAAKAVAAADWTAQLLTLDLLAKENHRFYEEILSLPVPAGLSPEDEQTYLSLLSQQAGPHKQRADDVGKKVQEFWAQNDSFEKLKNSFEVADPKLRSFATEEVNLLKERAPANIQAQMQTWSPSPPQATGLTVADVEKARESVREKPLDKARVQNLLDVEKKMGHEQMVQYLESRLSAMNEINKNEVKQ